MYRALDLLLDKDGDAPPSGLSADEQRAYDQLDFFYKKGLGYATEHVRRAARYMGIAYQATIDSDYGVWRAFGSDYWLALYVVDAQGRRHHQFGEGEYDRAEAIVRQLLAEAGVGGLGDAPAAVDDQQPGRVPSVRHVRHRSPSVPRPCRLGFARSAQRPERRAHLAREQLRQLPRREVPALADPVVVDELGVGPLRPAPRRPVLLAGEDAHGHRNGDALGVEESAPVLPVETGRGDPRVRQPVQRA